MTFQSSFNSFYFSEQCMRIPVAPYPCQHLLLFAFNFSLSNEYKVVSHHDFNFYFISLMTNDNKHFLCAYWPLDNLF